MRWDRRVYDFLQVQDPTAAYGLAAAGVAAMVLVRVGLQQIDGSVVPVALLFPTVLLSSVMGGLGPGFLAFAVSLVLTFLVMPVPESALLSGETVVWINLAVYALTAVFVIGIGAMLRSVSARFKEAQNEHRQGEHRLLVALEAGSLGTFWYDLDQRRGG